MQNVLKLLPGGGGFNKILSGWHLCLVVQIYGGVTDRLTLHLQKVTESESVRDTAVNLNNLRRLLVREDFIQLFSAYLHIKVLLPVSVLHMSVYASTVINK